MNPLDQFNYFTPNTCKIDVYLISKKFAKELEI